MRKVCFLLMISLNAFAQKSIDKNLVGTWTGNNETIEFRIDGKCIYGTNTFEYTISQKTILLVTDEGKSVFPYSINGNSLSLTINGVQFLYDRYSSNESGKINPPELVGQWCYLDMNKNSQTSRCIVLNGDGTFLYAFEGSRSVSTETLSGGTSSQNTDRGTWYVAGDRIYYDSQNSGKGSYKLEKRNHPKNLNDPMIVLDGEPFVTMTRRAPWR